MTLTTPFRLGGLTLPNRLVMAPMTRFRSPGGVPAAEVADYYRRRAENGVGLIVTEGTLVGHPSASHETTVPRMVDPSHWRHVTDSVHAAGGRIAAQLWHLGSEREGWSWTPSTMSVSDVDTIVEAFAASARVAVEAGFDAVEIHAAHGYLLDEFLWPETNRRTDAFGGTPGRRAAFPALVVGAVRAQLPAAMPLIVRFSQFKERDYTARIAASPAELAALLEPLAAAGADALHASQRRFWEPAFDGSPRNLAGWARHLTGLPSITVGSVALGSDFAHRQRLESGLDQGEFDLVAVGRILLANPSWARLALAGRFEEIRSYEKAHEDVYF
ncbi:12-oxophytodienoate reductase [Actinoplanes sp. NPDC023714]|uniref:oxidoreductase n=1 Tax=Actinoplanes sp. NPDC023714 TaxID=3154322 RepID=UPI003403BEDC